MVADQVEDDVVARPAAGDVLAGVIDDVVRAEGADELEVAPAAHPRHLGAERPGELDRERADPAGGTVDEDLLAWPDLADVAQPLQGGDSSHRDRGGLLEGEVGGLVGEEAFRDEGELAARDDLTVGLLPVAFVLLLSAALLWRRTALMRKLDARNRVELALWAFETGRRPR